MDIFDEVAERYDETMDANGQAAVLQRHIAEATDGLSYRSVLDVGIGTGMNVSHYSRPGVERVVGIEPCHAMRERLREVVGVEVIPCTAQEADLTHEDFDLAVFTLSLAWMDEQRAVLDKVLGLHPSYVLISEQVLREEERQAVGAGHANQTAIQQRFNPVASEGLDEVLSAHGLFPLVRLKDPVFSSDGHPAGSIYSTLYSRSKPDTAVYDEAALICQINSYCNRTCRGCYAVSTGKSLSPEHFRDALNEIDPESIVALRGGEPTLYPEWYERFVKPALVAGHSVVIDSNGAFIQSRNYDQVLTRLANKRITMRISFDERHLAELSLAARDAEFEKVAQFAAAAREKGIQLRFSALGMDARQIDKMLTGTPLEPYKDMFTTLTFVSDIRDVPIRGKYMDVAGKIHDRITE